MLLLMRLPIILLILNLLQLMPLLVVSPPTPPILLNLLLLILALLILLLMTPPATVNSIAVEYVVIPVLPIRIILILHIADEEAEGDDFWAVTRYTGPQRSAAVPTISHHATIADTRTRQGW